MSTTPTWADHYAVFLEDLRQRLQRRGAKMQLARWLADGGDERAVKTRQIQLWKILEREQVPGADVSEAIRHWMKLN